MLTARPAPYPSPEGRKRAPSLSLARVVPPDLDDLYDDVTIAALDGRDRPHRAEPAMGMRAHAAAGALVAALALGVQEVMEPRRVDEVVIEVDATEPVDPNQPVRVVHVPYAPRASRAYVRPWLFS